MPRRTAGVPSRPPERRVACTHAIPSGMATAVNVAQRRRGA